MAKDNPLSIKAAAPIPVDHSKDGESQVTYIVSVLTLACVLSTTAVVLRLYTRSRILHTFGADDAVMGFAQVLTLASATTIYLETSYGLGHHTWLLTDYVAYMKSFYASIIVYNVATCVLKISILLQLRRIFKNQLMQKLTLIGLVFEGVWALTLSILLPLICNPVAAFWDTNIHGKCLNELAIWYVTAAINLVTDFITFSLPLPVIKSLQLPTRQKVMLMGVFCLGFFTCIISVYRITTLKAAADSTDPTWENTDAAVWSILEVSIGILAACLPTLKPLFAMVLPRLFKSTITSQANRYHEYSMSGRKSKSGTKTLPSGAMYVKNVDDDMAALRTDGSFGSANGDVEMPTYQVSVTGGSPKPKSVFSGAMQQGPSGIQTTTVVTQRYDSL